MTDSAIHSPHEDLPHVNEVETINEEDFKALRTDDMISTDNLTTSTPENDRYSTEEDAAISEKLRHFLEDGEYLENFDYYDQASFETVSLTSGSGAANISISRIPLYKQLKAKNPKFSTIDFRVLQYKEFL